MKALLLLVCLLVAAATPSAAQTNSSTADLEQAIADAIRRHQPVGDPGVAVAVLQDRKLLYAGGFGLRDRATALKVDPETLFAIGSATKAFTSMAVCMLAEQGAIALGVPITQYLPDFGMQDPDAQARMTLEDILSHRGGLPRHDALWYLAPFSRAQLFHRLRYLDANTKPGKGFRKAFDYNSMTYSAAAFVLEAVAGEAWETFVKNRIIDPLGMARSSLALAAFQASANRAKGYFKDVELPLKDFDNIAPAAAINSNALEMARWVLLHLNHGVTAAGTRIIDLASLEKMYAGYIGMGGGAESGLGWVIQSVQGRRLVSHTGIADGYSVYVSFMPDDGLGVVVLTNQHFDFNAPAPKFFPALVATEIYVHLRQALKEHTAAIGDVAHAQASVGMERAHPAGPPAANGQSSGGAHPPAGSVDAGSAAAPGISMRGYTGRPSDYAGVFSHPAFGDISITVRGDIPYMSYYSAPWALQKLALGTLPVVPDLFLVSFRASGFNRLVPITFNRNAAGEVDKLSFPLEKEVKPIQFGKR